jgi:transposase
VSQPSYEELAAEVRRLRVLVEELGAENAELRRRLAQNSRNSSKPPSGEGLGKPAPKSRRKRSGRKPGGQPGHEGRTLEQVDNPDEVRRHEPGTCAGCGGDLSDARCTGVERRQVFDLPPVAVRVVEHQLVARRCDCGTTTRAQAPVGVDAPVQYGPRIAAILVYLYVGQFLSRQRTAEALAELFGVPISSGTVAGVTARAAAQVENSGFVGLVRDRIAAAKVAHFDETGFRVAGKLHWVHSASTGKYSLITVHARRGVEAMNAAGVLPAFSGVAVHDAWAPYDTYTCAGHALCGAHVLRELTAVIETAPAGTYCWARQASDALLECKRLVDAAVAAEAPAVDAVALAHQTRLLRCAASIGASQNRDRVGKLAKKQHALARRLLDRQGDYLRFTTDFAVPFDNNAAEREIRMIKVRQKVSGCARTLPGAQAFCAIRSYLATAHKHGTHFFQALTMLTEGRPWLPATA